MSRETASREVRRAVAATGLTRAAFAKRAGVDAGTLGDFLDGKRWAQAPTRRKIERALKWPAGRISELEQEPDATESLPSTIEAAIRDDPSLQPIAKAHLLTQVALLRYLRDGLPPELAEELERRVQAALADVAAERIAAEARTAAVPINRGKKAPRSER
jgi:transcriptional regulator with XRE-family HTH domain